MFSKMFPSTSTRRAFFSSKRFLTLHGIAGITRISLSPGQRFEEVVLPDLDVGRHQVGNAGVGAAEHDVLAGTFQMVVDDLEGPGAVPAHDGLRVQLRPP